MTKDEKIALSKRFAELYGVDAGIYVINDSGQDCTKWLIDDTKRMFELAVEHGINVRFDNKAVYILHKSLEMYADHHTKLEATLVAIAKALIKLKEQQ